MGDTTTADLAQHDGNVLFPWITIYFIGPLGETMHSHSQISATVSVATKEKFDRFAESHGLKKNFVVEQALLYFMDARSQLPDEALVPTRLVLDDDAFDRIVALLAAPPAPTPALRELMRGHDD
jgi:uncharacterized protein (DUF1778 family)